MKPEATLGCPKWRMALLPCLRMECALAKPICQRSTLSRTSLTHRIWFSSFVLKCCFRLTSARVANILCRAGQPFVLRAAMHSALAIPADSAVQPVRSDSDKKSHQHNISCKAEEKGRHDATRNTPQALQKEMAYTLEMGTASRTCQKPGGRRGTFGSDNPIMG